MLVFAAWHGVELVSVPVGVYYPKPEERVSHFRPVRDFSRIFILNTLLCVLALVYGLPLALWRALMTFLRSAYSLLFFLGFTIIIAPPYALYHILFVRDLERKRMGLHKLIYFFARLVTVWHGIPGVKLSVGNPCLEDFSRPAIVISGHQSLLDLMTMLMLSPKLVCLTKDWVWNNPLYGYIIRGAEFYRATEGMDILLPKLHSLVERGYSIVVYPEGTRSADGSVSHFHQGAFYLARQLGINILPIVSYGAGKVLPRKGKLLRKWPIRIEIDRRLSPEEMQAFGATARKQASEMRKFYMHRYNEIANRIEQDV